MYHYVGNNPVKYVDPDGRIVDEINPHYTMSGNTTVIPNSGGTTISTGGCAIALVANISYTNGNTNTTPTAIALNSNNFTVEGNLIWNLPLPENVSTNGKVSSPLTFDLFDEYNNSEMHYCIGIRVQYTGSTDSPSNSPHWVGVNATYTDEDGNQYFVISKTSNQDSVMGTMAGSSINNRGGLGWKVIDNVGIVVPINRVTEHIIFEVNNED